MTQPNPPPWSAALFDTDLERILLPRSRSTAERISSSLARGPHYDRPQLRAGAVFLSSACLVQPGAFMCNHRRCRCIVRMADMSKAALLTIRSKSISRLVAARRLRILLPRTRFARHRVPAVSSSLGSDPPGRWRILLPRQCRLLRFGFGPIIRLHPRMEPLFLRRAERADGDLRDSCMAEMCAARLSPAQDCGIVEVTSSRGGLPCRALQGQPLRRSAHRPCPSPRAGPFFCAS
jgi:hypothetical protein